jgi:Competence protein
LRQAIKKWAALAALIAAFFYLLLSGAEVATQRAFITTAIVLVAVMVDRSALTLRNLALAAFGVMLLAAEAVGHPSFQMSRAVGQRHHDLRTSGSSLRSATHRCARRCGLPSRTIAAKLREIGIGAPQWWRGVARQASPHWRKVGEARDFGRRISAILLIAMARPTGLEPVLPP